MLATVSRHLPALIFVLLLLAAALVFAAGWRLSRHEETRRDPRDRASLRAFADRARMQLHSLELAYEKRLRNAAALVDLNDEAATHRVCDEVVGIARCSLLYPPGRGKPDTQTEIDYRKDGAPVAMPTFRGGPSSHDRSAIILAKEDILETTDSGWLDEPGKPLLFWYRRTPDCAVVLTLHVPALVAAISTDLRSAAADYQRACQTSKASTAGGMDRWTGPDGITVAGGHELTGPPDFALPLNSRFGTWQIESWDPQVTKAEVQPLGLALSALFSLGLALVGAGTFVHQRRALRLAAQRVSFVNSVSHELRTPLTNMLLNLDVAADAIDPDNAEAGKRLGLVREEGGRLGRLIENVLTFSRAEQGRLHLQPRPCHIHEIVSRIAEQFRPLLERKAIALTLHVEATDAVVIDPDALAQILANLLSNLEKYAPAATAELRAELAQGDLHLTLSDTGCGIPASEAERIFQPFERLNASLTQGTTGTGLGLSIARDLARLMGGTLRLLPSDKGATFELRIPAPSP